MKNYLEVLQFFMRLISEGKIKEATELVVQLSDIVAKLLALFMPTGQVTPLVQQVVAEPTDEERVLENQIALAIQGHTHPHTPGTPVVQAQFDFSKIRKAFAFLKASGILDLLMKTVLAGSFGGLTQQFNENPTTVKSEVPPQKLDEPKK